MMVIGIDSHKDHLAACLIEETGRAVEHRLIGNTSRGHAELAAWAQHRGVGRVAVEGSGSYGRPAALVLLQAGVNVVEVPPQMTAHARRGQRTGTKTDPSDALLIARIAARDDDLPPPRPDGPTEDLRCVTAYRRELVKSRNQHINRLHGDLEQTRCGYHRKIPGVLSSPKALTRISRLLSGNTSTRAQIARRRIRHIRELNRQITDVTTEIASLVTAVNTTLTNIYGIGALTAAEILAETGDPAPVRDQRQIRDGQRHSPPPGQLRQNRPPQAQPRRKPPAQQSHPHRCNRPNRQTPQRRTPLLPTLPRPRQNQKRSHPSPQTQNLRPHLDPPPTNHHHAKFDIGAHLGKGS